MDSNDGTLREWIGEVAQEAATKTQLRQIIHDALGSEQARTVECPECGHDFRAKVPDLKKQLDVVIALLEQKEGRAGERPPEATQVLIHRPAL